MFDAWEYPQKCEGCGRYDNDNEKEPTCVLDAKTKLCEFCYEDQDEDGE